MPREPGCYPFRKHYCTDAGPKPKHKLCLITEGIVEAKRQLRQYLVQLDNEKAALPVPIKKSNRVLRNIDSVCEHFLAFKKVETSHKTYTFYAARLAVFRARFGARLLSSLTEQDGLDFKVYLLSRHVWHHKTHRHVGVSNTTVRHCFHTVRNLFRWINVTLYPWSRIKLPKQAARQRLITPDEFQYLFDNATTAHFRLMLLCLRCIPFRPSEVRTLDYSWIDFEKHIVTVPSNSVKTRVQRKLTLVEPVESLLQERWVAAGRPSNGFVFQVGRNNTVYSDSTFSSHFWQLVQKCVKKGLISLVINGEKLVLYSARHTRITELVLQGVHIAHIQQEAGHTSYQTTQRYVHLAQSDTASAIRAALPLVPSSPPANPPGPPV